MGKGNYITREELGKEFSTFPTKEYVKADKMNKDNDFKTRHIPPTRL
jgi:hypothetical protein